jgi:hypothetical protein
MLSEERVRLEAAIDQLPFSDQLWLMERLARRIRERSEHAPDSRDRELEEMANNRRSSVNCARSRQSSP